MPLGSTEKHVDKRNYSAAGSDKPYYICLNALQARNVHTFLIK